MNAPSAGPPPWAAQLEPELPVQLRSLGHAVGMLEHLPSGSKLVCELRLAGGRHHTKVLWLAGVRNSLLMCRTLNGVRPVHRTFLADFIARGQLYVVSIINKGE